MFYAMNSFNNKIDADTAVKGFKYKCPCCEEEVILAKGTVNLPYFKHKKLKDCDTWYEQSKLLKNIQKKFSINQVDVVVKSDKEKHRCNIVTDSVFLTVLGKNISGDMFVSRLEFYNNFQTHKQIYLFDLDSKDIYITQDKGNNVYSVIWKHAYKLSNLNIPTLKYYSNCDIYFYFKGFIYKIIYNHKDSYKYCKVVRFTVDSFVKHVCSFKGLLYSVPRYEYKYLIPSIKEYLENNLGYLTMVNDISHFRYDYVNKLKDIEKYLWIDTSSSIYKGKLYDMFSTLFNNRKIHLFKEAKDIKITKDMNERLDNIRKILGLKKEDNQSDITQYEALLIYKKLYDKLVIKHGQIYLDN